MSNEAKSPITDNNNNNESTTNTISANELLSSCNMELLIMEKINASPSSKTCTYNEGYKSQELFSCLTCLKETKKEAYICLGCSFKCHKDHEMLSLYFKRKVRCDCGNSRFITECSLYKNKDYDNIENVYSHNCNGRYCYCDSEENGNEMIQCIICEDWFHIEHIKLHNANKDAMDKGDFICKKCIQDKIKFIFEGYDIRNMLPSNVSEEISPKKRKLNEIEKANKKCKYEIKEKYKLFVNEIISNENDIIIYANVLESELCHCTECDAKYKSHNVEFLCGAFYTEWNKRILFEEIINNDLDEEKEENKKIISNINSINMYQTNEIRSLDVIKQTELSMMSKEFYSKFKEYIHELSQREENKNKQLTITYDDIQDFLKKFKNRIPKQSE